jgi:CP family cyanate transporter-like MFS transporter
MKSRDIFISLGLLWLAGAALRMTVLALPPLLPLIHGDLDLSETEIGTLAGLPALMFAAIAVPGSLVIARFGARRALIAGLLVTALAGAARAAASDVATLFAATLVMGGGIAVMQPALPPIVRAWLPDRIGFATAVYTNGLLIGEILAVSLTLPVVLPLAGGSWRSAIAFWGLPVLFIALLVALLGPRRTAAQARRAGGRGGRIGGMRASGSSAFCSAASTAFISPPTPSCPNISTMWARPSSSAAP